MQQHRRWAIIVAALTFSTGTAQATAPLSSAIEAADQKIVYARSAGAQDLPERTEIYIMNADGSEVLRLTDNQTEDAFPVLSPDGTQVAFSRNVRGQFELLVMDSDGTNARRMIRSPNADEVLPSWSPDGRKLAFTATTAIPGGWQSDIYRIRVNDARFRRLTYTPKTKEFAPDWSPDGTLVAFTKQNEKREKYGIALVQPNVQGLRWLVVNPLSKSGYTDVNPSWSPDSQWVAFSRDHGDDPYVDIYKVARDGSDVTAVTEMSELAENPVWGADGRILFMHNEGIAIVTPEGGDLQHVTPTRTGLPYWWPDW